VVVYKPAVFAAPNSPPVEVKVYYNGYYPKSPPPVVYGNEPNPPNIPPVYGCYYVCPNKDPVPDAV